ncbi:MAG: hypothetical protein JSR82_07065 [Verrucomicrobia bacterium]|nr:hypothetical protein [Verrucomicrobiota bacterium]
MKYTLTAALCAALLLPALGQAQSGSNSFHGLYEATVVANTAEIVIYSGLNGKNTCIYLDYSARTSRTAVFAVNAAGQFSFTFNPGGQTASGTLTETGFSGTVAGRSFSGTRYFMDGRSNALQGAYSGWAWKNDTGALGIITWISSPTGKAYLHMDFNTTIDGGSGTMGTGGTFSIKSVLDGFLYNNSAPSGDGHFLLVDGQAEGSFYVGNNAYIYFQVNRKNSTYRLLNVSTRGTVGTGTGVMIAGFVVGGGGKRVVVRALGPTLTGFGVAGALADPQLEIYNSGGTLLASNDNWQAGPTVNQVTGAGLAPANASESALGITLEPGSYTAVVKGVGNTTGVALVEVYEID